MNNPYFLSALVGFVTYIVQMILYKTKNQATEKIDLLKISLFVTICTFILLNFYEKAPSPVLSEPFISSGEV